MKYYQQQSDRKGFTIIEMLIAVFIFTVAISALTYMAGRGIRSSNDSQDRIIAEYLATEGMEVVRNVRDSAFLAGLPETSWTGVFGGNISGPNGCFNALGDSNQDKTCAFQYEADGTPTLENCPTSACSLFLNPTTYIYSYESGNATPFSRKIYLNQVSQSEIKVRTVVEWRNESIEYQENLFLWG